MNDCIFCKIIKKEIPASIVYEDSKTIAFLDIAPASPKGGHTLVMSKNHYELISEISDEDVKAVILTVKKLSKALLKFAEGLNIIQNNKRVAGQLVPHAHFHLIPRFVGDGITVEKWSAHKYKDSKEIEEVAAKIKKLL